MYKKGKEKGKGSPKEGGERGLKVCTALNGKRGTESGGTVI